MSQKAETKTYKIKARDVPECEAAEEADYILDQALFRRKIEAKNIELVSVERDLREIYEIVWLVTYKVTVA